MGLPGLPSHHAGSSLFPGSPLQASLPHCHHPGKLQLSLHAGVLQVLGMQLHGQQQYRQDLERRLQQAQARIVQVDTTLDESG